MAKAEKLLDERITLDDGWRLALRLWIVPTPVPPSLHRFKYALFYGRPGERLVCFDNERGKGDHKHIMGKETAYVFVSPRKLLMDFEEAVRIVRGQKDNVP